MTRNDLYELEIDVYKNIDIIKREQEKYREGVEYGIELMFKAVKAKLDKEEQPVEEVKVKENCSNCGNKTSVHCENCIASYDRATNTHSTPSHWKPKESEDTE